jgi:hypothetical protein
MALVRCEKHGRPNGRTRNYVGNVKPIGFPDTAAVRGLHKCENPGLIWLEQHELEAYRQGQRVFYGESSVMKARAD